jgi:hypothetical protein
MADEPTADDTVLASLGDVGAKLDTVAGALAAIASSHTELLAHVAEAEARRREDALAIAQRLDALERQALTASSHDEATATGAGEVGDVVDALQRVEERVEQRAEQGRAQVDELAQAVAALTWKLPEVVDDLATIRAELGRLASGSDDAAERLALHSDKALAAVLRLLDDRLTQLRQDLPTVRPQEAPGFEVGAVMGAAQAAWTQLEHRLDTEFDDLGRQLQAIVALIEQVSANAEAVANRPVVSGDQIRRAATSLRDSVVSANRARRERRGGPKGLTP